MYVHVLIENDQNANNEPTFMNNIDSIDVILRTLEIFGFVITTIAIDAAVMANCIKVNMIGAKIRRDCLR